MIDAIPAPMAQEGSQFSIGRAFSMTFGVLARNVKAMAPIALVVAAVQSGIDHLLSGDPIVGNLGSSILAMFAYALIIAPVSYATFQDLRGVRLDAGAMMSGGFNRVGRVIGASFAVWLVAFVPAVIVGFLWAVTHGLLGIFFGTVAAVLIAYILVRWFVVIPVLVVEDVRFFSGFGRSSDLSRGRRWGMFGLLLVYGILVVAVSAVIYAIATLAADAPVLAQIVIVPLSALYSVVGAILPAVVYYLLRAEKEAIGIDDIAKVFD